MPVGLILLLTLVPTDLALDPGVGCIECGEHPLSDAVLNVVLYIPFGIVSTLVGWRRRRTLIGGLLISVFIEFAQYFIPGRYPTVTDVGFNFVGAIVGVALVESLSLWLRPTGRTAGRLSVVYALFAVALLGLNDFLLRPHVPRGRYFVQWTARFDDLEWYDGRVLGVTLGDRFLPRGWLEDSDAVRRLLRQGADLRVRLVVGSRVSRLAPLLSVSDHPQRRILFLGVEGEDVVIWYRTRAMRLGLDQPDLRAVDVMEGSAPGDTVSLILAEGRGGFCLTVEPTTRCELGVTPGRGWGLLVYLEFLPGWLRTGLDGAWIALLVGPLGLWFRPRRECVLAVLFVAAGLFWVPLVGRLEPLGVTGYFGCALGFLVGWNLRRRRASGRPGG